MVATAFDILNYVRRLKEAGVSETQAEAQVEIMAEIQSIDIEKLVTRDYLDTRLTSQELKFEKRFAILQSELKLQRWILAAIAASTVVPALVRLVSL